MTERRTFNAHRSCISGSSWGSVVRTRRGSVAGLILAYFIHGPDVGHVLAVDLLRHRVMAGDGLGLHVVQCAAAKNCREIGETFPHRWAKRKRVGSMDMMTRSESNGVPDEKRDALVDLWVDRMALPRITFGMIVLSGEPFTRRNLRSIYP
jgi:hypothetical protein